MIEMTAAGSPAREALIAGDATALDLILKSGADPVQRDQNGFSMIEHAVIIGNVDAVRVLAQAVVRQFKSAAKVESELSSAIGRVRNIYTMSTFHNAQKNMVEILDILLSHGARIRPEHAIYFAASDINFSEALKKINEYQNVSTLITSNGEPLIIPALRAGSISNIETLLKLGANPGAKSWNGMNVAEIVVRRQFDRLEIMRLLQAHGERFSKTQIAEAIRVSLDAGEGNVWKNALPLLIGGNELSPESVADPDALDAIPSFIDAHGADLTVRILIEYGADVSAKHIESAISASKPSTKAIATLLMNFGKNGRSELPEELVCRSAQTGHYKNIKAILDCGFKIESDYKKRLTPVMEAVKHANIDTARYLIAAAPNLALHVDRDGNSFAHHAAMSGGVKLFMNEIEALIAKGHPIAEKNNSGMTPVDLLIEKRWHSSDFSDAMRLIKAGVKVRPELFVMTHLGIANGSVDYNDFQTIMNITLESAKLRWMTPKDRASLCEGMIGADVLNCYPGISMIKKLGLGKDLLSINNVFCGERGNAITFACNVFSSGYNSWSRHTSILKDLISMGVKPNVRNEEGLTPAMLCLCACDAQSAQMIMKNGGDLWGVKESDQVALLRIIIAGSKHVRGAIRVGNDSPNDCLRFALEHGADPNGVVNRSISSYGKFVPGKKNTLLSMAAWVGNNKAVKILLDHGANPELKLGDDDEGAEAMALSNGHKRAAELIARAKAMARGELGEKKAGARARVVNLRSTP